MDTSRAQSEGNDVIVYEAPNSKAASVQRSLGGEPPRNCCASPSRGRRKGVDSASRISLRRRASGKMDVIGLSLVTIGRKASVETQRLFEGGEYTKYLYLHGLSVETAEALAELHHKKMREELGIAGRRCCGNPRSLPSEVSWARAIRLAIRRARTWKIRRSCLHCSSRKRTWACG